MKRLVNAYGIERGRQIREGATLNDERRQQSVLWTILRLRWPLVAEHLAKDPGILDRLGEHRTDSEAAAVPAQALPTETWPDDPALEHVIGGTGLPFRLTSSFLSGYLGVQEMPEEPRLEAKS
jgi:hypothetical protein